MPTSSQAMILRCNMGSDRPRISFKAVSPFPSSPPPKSSGFEIETCSTSSPKGNGELVKFDFSVSTSGDRSLDGFQGMFAYDQKTNSYKWQICSVLPKSPSRSPEKLGSDMQCGDFINEEQFSTTTSSHEEEIEESESESFIHGDPSEHTVHFTTPVVSVMDNLKENLQSTNDPATELRPKTPQRPPSLSLLTFPLDTGKSSETSYRRIEDLGVRHRTRFMPGGPMVRVKPDDGHLPPPPRNCYSESRTERERAATLTISNLDVAKVPKPASVPYKIQGFQPKPFITGDSMRKRVRPTKQKSLLQEVKEQVRWDKRIAPPTRLSGGSRPGFQPTTVCFSLREGWAYTHAEVKEMVEEQLHAQVTSVRYEPLSVRCPESGLLDRWLVKFPSRHQTDHAVKRGLAVDGDVVIVKAWDDVIRDEYLSEGDWNYPCSFRLQSDKHKHVLQKFLKVQ